MVGQCVVGQIATGNLESSRGKVRGGVSVPDIKKFHQAGRRQLTGYKEGLLGGGVSHKKDYVNQGDGNGKHERPR